MSEYCWMVCDYCRQREKEGQDANFSYYRVKVAKDRGASWTSKHEWIDHIQKFLRDHYYCGEENIILGFE